MMTYILLKCLADLGIYFTLAVIPAALFRVDYSLLWLAYPLMAGGLALSLPLSCRISGKPLSSAPGEEPREEFRGAGIRRLLSLLPLVPALMLFLLPPALRLLSGSGDLNRLPGLPHSLWYSLILLPALLFCLRTGFSGRLAMKQGQELDNFRLELILTGLLLLSQLLLYAWHAMTGYTIPLSMTVLACQILLMRALRHDREVYCHRSYQLRNLGILLAVLAAALLFSSHTFLAGARQILGILYDGLLLPVLMVLAFLLEKILYAAFWLISRLLPDFRAELQFDTGASVPSEEYQKMLENMPESGLWGTALRAILILLVIAAVIWLLSLLFAYISRSGEGIVELDRQTTERISLKNRDDVPSLGGLFRPRDPVMQVRLIYRNYLKLVRSTGTEYRSCDTSAEILERSRPRLSPDPARRLREIYLAARYNGTAGKAEVKAAEAALRELRDSSRSVGPSGP